MGVGPVDVEVGAEVEGGAEVVVAGGDGGGREMDVEVPGTH